ncbi:MAG: L,D-transpeptidase family protein [Verrucomicrobia bacterium]|nr:L,D-transpeptidase family protein [Verrucomicrobiota bacterium]
MAYFEKIIRPMSISPLLMRVAAGLAMLASAAVFSSCGVGGAKPTARSVEPVLYGWHDDGGPGKVTVRISLPDQIAEYERGGRPIGWSYVATGKEGHGTNAGTYRITEKIVDKYSNKYGWIEDELGNVVDGDAKVGDRVPKGMRYVPAPMPFWMRLTSYGIGMHGGLIPEPGKPASHGCIRLPKDFVPLVFDVVVVGTPVTITQAPSRHGPISPGLQQQLAASGGPTPLGLPTAPMP